MTVRPAASPLSNRTSPATDPYGSQASFSPSALFDKPDCFEYGRHSINAYRSTWVRSNAIGTDHRVGHWETIHRKTACCRANDLEAVRGGPCGIVKRPRSIQARDSRGRARLNAKPYARLGHRFQS